MLNNGTINVINNVICTPFQCVGFVGLKWKFVYFPHQHPFMVFAKFPCVGNML